MSILSADRAADAAIQARDDPRADPGPERTSRHRHYLANVVLALVVLALLALTWPVQHGGHLGITIVTGHSMEPTLHTGDIVLTWKQSTYKPGDVVVYPVPDGPGAGIDVIHRLIGFQPDGTLITQGDNNKGPDPWHPTRATVLGSQVGLIPVAGNGIDLLRRPWILALLLAAIAGACAYWLALDLTREPAPSTPDDLTPSPEDTPGRAAQGSVPIPTP